MKRTQTWCAVGFLVLCHAGAQAQTDSDAGVGVDGGVSYVGRGAELLESIYVPNLPHAPFSLTLSTEWTRPLLTGGTMTAINSRPIRRDSEGRIYMERWLLVPKGTNVRSRMSWIQIDDPVAGLYYECNARTHVCEKGKYEPGPAMPPPPSATRSGPVSNGKAYRQHEDLGDDVVAGAPVRAYRDTVTVNTGAMGNSQPIRYIREMKYSSQLGFNLMSIVQSPSLGEQRFVVTEITTTEPEARWFQPPEGYSVVDKQRPN